MPAIYKLTQAIEVPTDYSMLIKKIKSPHVLLRRLTHNPCLCSTLILKNKTI